MGAKKCPDKVKMHWYYYLAGTIGPHDIENTSYSLSLSPSCVSYFLLMLMLDGCGVMMRSSELLTVHYLRSSETVFVKKMPRLCNAILPFLSLFFLSLFICLQMLTISETVPPFL